MIDELIEDENEELQQKIKSQSPSISPLIAPRLNRLNEIQDLESENEELDPNEF